MDQGNNGKDEGIERNETLTEGVVNRRQHKESRKDALDISPGKKENVQLKKNVGIVGGSGIFISSAGVLENTGSIGLSLIVWGLSGVLSLIGSLSYAELGCIIPKSGEYPYLRRSLGKIVAFMFAWTKVVVLTPSSIAICSLTFAEYAVTYVDKCRRSDLLKMIASMIIVTISGINCWNTKLAVKMQVVFTSVKLISIGVIIIGGLVWFVKGSADSIEMGFTGTSLSSSSIALGFYDALWAYEGWNVLTYLTEELKNPHKNLPRANLIGISLVTVVYVLVNISYVIVLGKDGVLESNAVAMKWGRNVMGSASVMIPVFVMVATYGSMNGTLFAGGRTLYASARDHQFPEVLSYINCRRYTPVPSILFTTVMALCMLIPEDIASLINFLSFASWLFYSLTIISLLVLRVKMKNAERPIKVFIVLPLLFLVCSIYLTVAPIISNPGIEFLYAFLFIVSGLVFYIPFVFTGVNHKCLKPVTRYIQLLMEVVPSPYEPTF